MELTVGAHRGGLVNTRSLRFALSVFSVLTVIMRTARVAATPGGAKFGGQFEESEDDQLPRILTVLTTYSGRSDFVTAYRDAAGARNDLIFVVSDEDDEDLDGNVDFKTGRPETHRSLAAIAEACARFEGQFDWIALGDDDTFFMINRAQSFLKYLDHTQPLTISRPQGLSRNSLPVDPIDCFTREQKDTPDSFSIHGCCEDFTQPCPVQATWPLPRNGRPRNRAERYGPGGLFWPYGGSGVFVSVGMAKALGGAKGFNECAQRVNHNTDVMLAMCMKAHGYALGDYRNGFLQHVASLDPAYIKGELRANCQVLGVHLGIRHGPGGQQYGPEVMGDAVAALVQLDDTTPPIDVGKRCPSAWEQLVRWI